MLAHQDTVDHGAVHAMLLEKFNGTEGAQAGLDLHALAHDVGGIRVRVRLHIRQSYIAAIDL